MTNYGLFVAFPTMYVYFTSMDSLNKTVASSKNLVYAHVPAFRTT